MVFVLLCLRLESACKVLCNRELNMQCAWVDRTVCDQVEDTTEKKPKYEVSLRTAKSESHKASISLLPPPIPPTHTHPYTRPQTRLVKILSRKFLTRQSAKASNLYKYFPPHQVPLYYLYKKMYSAKIE